MAPHEDQPDPGNKPFPERQGTREKWRYKIERHCPNFLGSIVGSDDKHRTRIHHTANHPGKNAQPENSKADCTLYVI